MSKHPPYFFCQFSQPFHTVFRLRSQLLHLMNFHRRVPVRVNQWHRVNFIIDFLNTFPMFLKNKNTFKQEYILVNRIDVIIVIKISWYQILFFNLPRLAISLFSGFFLAGALGTIVTFLYSSVANSLSDNPLGSSNIDDVSSYDLFRLVTAVEVSSTPSSKPKPCRRGSYLQTIPLPPHPIKPSTSFIFFSLGLAPDATTFSFSLFSVLFFIDVDMSIASRSTVLLSCLLPMLSMSL